MSLVDIKRQARQALHSGMAVPAAFVSADGSRTIAVDAVPGLTVRWHNKLARNGALDGDYKGEIIEGIDRLVFNQPELDALALTLDREDVITIPGYGTSWELDALEPGDGPLNVYWTVTGLGL